MNKEIEGATVEGFLRGLKIMFSVLDKKERELLIIRHGIISGETATLEEVGRHFGVTRERIRQIEAKAHEKIRQLAKDVEIKI